MVSLKCKSCGDMIVVENNQTVVVCESCGNRYEVPLDEKKEQFLNLYSRADDAWDHKDFEEASDLYNQILEKDNTQSEAHFGLVLCKYGITYEIDPVTQKKMPNCNRINRDSILDDKHYQAAIKYAPPKAAATFKSRAQEIDRISRDFLKIVDKEPPYDVFISYKRTGEDGNITQDSKVARKLYYHLTEKGYKVFFAEVTLQDHAGELYEPYIFAALSSAPVMVLLGSRPEHFEATWVKNEWRRYLALMSQGYKKTLIPAYFIMKPDNIPGMLRNYQAMDAADMTFQEDITERIRKKVADARDGSTTSETQGTSLKDKYAPKEKVDKLVDQTDCERDFAINVLIQLHGDVKESLKFIQDDPDYKKQLWKCAECGAANTHDKCHNPQCGLSKKESLELEKSRAQIQAKKERESAAYKAAQKQKRQKTTKTIIILAVVAAILGGLYLLGNFMATVNTETLAAVATVAGFIIGLIVFFLLGAPGGLIGIGISVGVCVGVLCGILFGFRALFISNVDDLYTPEIVQTYTGSYNNSTAVLKIDECDDQGILKGTFFYKNKDSQPGLYEFTGAVTTKKSNGTLKLSFTPTKWILQPGKDELPGEMTAEVTDNYTNLSCSNPSITLHSGNDETALKTPEDLKRLAGSSETYFLAEDIDLSGSEWKPIEDFKGLLVGNGHIIKGMTIKADSDNVGFFSTLSGTVIDLQFQEAKVTVSGRRENVGILCGKLESTKIESSNQWKIGTVINISVDGTVTATTGTNVGGIIGKVEINSTLALTDLNNKANVSGLTKVGGIVGSIEKEVNDANTATLTKLTNTGDITASGDYAGGTVGYMRQVTSSGFSAVVVTASELSNNATIKGSAYVGGIFGSLETDTADSTLQDATSSGTVEAKCFAGCIGGKLDTIAVSNCTNEGSTLNVSGYLSDNGEKYAYVGGIAGFGYVANNCTNSVSIHYTGTGRYVGGIFGYARFGIDQTLAGLTNNADISGYSYVGGIFGALESESSNDRTITLTNFKNTGAISGQSLYTGGIMGYTKHFTSSGYSEHTLVISDFTNTGDVTGTGYTGGIFGHVKTDSTDSTMQDCANASNVTGEYYVGCIAGQALLITVNDCANIGSTLTATGSTTVEGEKYAYVGGFVGNGFAANNCTNEVEINYAGDGRYVGGIMGCINRGDSENTVSNYTMTDLKNNAAITSSGSYVGGIFGCLHHTDNGNNTVELKAFENSAAITGNKYVGGIVGCMEAYTDSGYNEVTVYAYNFVNTGNISSNSSSTSGGIFGYGKTDSNSSAIIDAQTGSYGNLEKIQKS